MGKIIDKFNSRTGCLVNIGSFVVVISLSIWTVVDGHFNYITILACFFWGLNDGFINTHSM